MNKYASLLIVFLLFLNSGLVFSSVIGVSEDSDNENGTYDISIIKQSSYDSYPPENVYFLTAINTFSTLNHLRGIPSVTDGSNPNLNKQIMTNGRTVSFIYPYISKQPAQLMYNPEFEGKPAISLVINTLENPGKTFAAKLGIDTNDNYDPHNPETLEHRCVFESYNTTIDRSTSPLEEEYYIAYGSWDGNEPPRVISKGRIILQVTMTSPNGDPALLYCGYNYKSSWLVVPYMHNYLVPRAKINDTYQDQGIPPKHRIFTGDRIYFDGSDSYDPKDDLNGNNEIDGFELDRLMYKWSWGDGSSTNLNYNNRFSSHFYQRSDIPKKSEYRDFFVNLTVKNRGGRTNSTGTWVRIYRGNHSPEIESVHINKVQVCPTPMREVVSVLSDKIKVYFSAQAFDPDGDELTYMWDFDGNLSSFEVTGDSETGAEVYYSFAEPVYQQGKYKLTLMVSDGTLANDTKAVFYINLRYNTDPVASIFASREGESDGTFYENEIIVKLKQTITFYGDRSYDPDGLVGFDTNNDSKSDKPLRYRWNFNSYNPQESTEWSYNSVQQYSYNHPGRFKYWVTLNVDDGVNVTTSKPFKVIINSNPMAKILIESSSYDTQGNLQPYKPVIFNGSQSYDPNGDLITEYVWGFYYEGEMKRKYNSSFQFTYEEPGLYTISLQVFDGELWSYPDTIQFEIIKPPRCFCSNYKVFPLEVFTYEQVYFIANLSTQPGFIKDNLEYTWQFGDGEEETTNANHTTYKYTRPGIYLISLTVSDFYNQSETYSNILVTVKNRAPEAKITKTSNKHAGWNVVISSKESYDRDGKIMNYTWTFGDGSGELLTTDTNVEHTWDEGGIYVVHLTVHDDHGSTSDAYMTFIVTDIEDKSDDTQFIIGISILLLFNLITIPLLIRQLALLHTRKKNKKSSKK